MFTVEQAINEKWDLNRFIEAIGDVYPLFAEFANTEQDSQWHAEGDVHIHTDMVLKEMYHILQHDLRNAPLRDKAILLLATLFHDYAKPLCTKVREIKGVERVVAPNHESAGASLLFYLPPPLDLSNQDWYQVIQLTAYHHIPKRLVIKQKGMAEYAALSMMVEQLSWLYYLEKADMLGRTCSDKEEQLLILDIFKEESVRHQLWQTSAQTVIYDDFYKQVQTRFPALSEAAQQRILHQGIYHYEQGNIVMLEEELARAYQYKDSQSHLVLLCGISGAGKSAFTEHYLRQGYHLISLDELRKEMFKCREDQSNNDAVVRESRERLRQALREKKNIIWDATNTRIDFRNPMIGLGHAYSAFVEMILLQKPLPALFRDNKDRPHPIPEERLQDQVDTFQIPHRGDVHKLTTMLYHPKGHRFDD